MMYWSRWSIMQYAPSPEALADDNSVTQQHLGVGFNVFTSSKTYIMYNWIAYE